MKAFILHPMKDEDEERGFFILHPMKKSSICRGGAELMKPASSLMKVAAQLACVLYLIKPMEN